MVTGASLEVIQFGKKLEASSALWNAMDREMHH